MNDKAKLYAKEQLNYGMFLFWALLAMATVLEIIFEYNFITLAGFLILLGYIARRVAQDKAERRYGRIKCKA